MKQNHTFLSVCSAAITIALLTSSFPAFASEESNASQTAFDELVDSFYWDLMEFSPASLHFSQSSTENIPISLEKPLGSFTYDSSEQIALCNETLAALETIAYSDLTAHQKEVYLCLKESLNTLLKSLSLPDYSSTLGTMNGLLNNIDTIITEYYLLNETDIQNYMDMLCDIPRFLEEMLTEIEYQEGIGYAPSAYQYENALACEENMTTIEEHPYLTSFVSNLSECDLSEELCVSYTNQVTSILTDQVIPAYESFFDTLRTKAETAGEAHGLCYYDQGKEYYELLVRDNTGTTMTPSELMSYLEYKVAADLGYLSRIYLMNPTIDSKLETITLPYEDINSSFEALRSMSLELFPEIENSDYTISYLPESLEVSGNLAYYLNPPIDLPSRNVIRVNKSETDSDVLTLWTTLSHEGFPGHLYQTQYYRENISQYPLESLLENIGTSEGWAFYVERLALDWADIDSTFADYFWYNQTINMGLSAILDIGINYEGWDLTDLSDYIANYYGELEQADLQELYNSLASDPGIFLPYAVGYYQMDDLFKAIKNNYSCDSDMYVAFFKHSMLPFMLLNQYLGSDGSI